MSEQARLYAMSAEYDSAKKSQVVTWVLWIFLGAVGGHRYYLGDIGYAIAMTLLAWATFGIWWLIEAFLINRRIREKNRVIFNDVAYRYGGAAQPIHLYRY
jgi:TM2 domain-containing membrane protein YozV